jgi:hypothetical protein
MSLYDPRPPVDLGGDRSLWTRLVVRSRHVHVTIMDWAPPALADAVSAGRSTSTDLHDWDGENPHHLPFALGADLVFLSAATLGETAADVATSVLRDGRAQVVVVTDGGRGRRGRRRGLGLRESRDAYRTGRRTDAVWTDRLSPLRLCSNGACDATSRPIWR